MNPKKGPMALKPKDPKKTLLRLFSYFKYYKGLFFLGISAIVLASFAEIAATGMLSPIIDVFVDGGPLSQAAVYILILAGIVVAIAAGQYIGNRSMASLAQKIIHRLRSEMFAHMQKLPVSFFDTHSHGEMMSTFTNDVDMLNQSLEQAVSQVLISIVTVVGTYTMMIIISPLLTLVVTVSLIMMFFIIRFVGSRSANYFRNQQLSLADINGYIEEMMSGQKVVKVFNYEERAIEEFRGKNERLRIASSRASTFGTMLMPIMGNISFIVYSVVAVLGSLMAVKGVLTVGNIAAFLQYTRTISRPITSVSNQLNMLLQPLQEPRESSTSWMKRSKKTKVMWSSIELQKESSSESATIRWKYPSRAGERTHPVHRCQLWVYSWTEGFEEDQPLRQTGAENRSGRFDRCRQNHNHQPDQPFLRNRRGHRPLRWHRY